MKLRIAGTVNDSIVDGPGLRFTLTTVRAVIIPRPIRLRAGR